jgi:hypothetical protein
LIRSASERAKSQAKNIRAALARDAAVADPKKRDAVADALAVEG